MSPRGVYKRDKKEEVKETAPVVVETPISKVVPEVPIVKKAEAKKEDANVLAKCPGKPHLSKCQCKDPLAPGQAYFEDGPTGTVIIGDDLKNDILFREGNNGKGYHINRKR